MQKQGAFGRFVTIRIPGPEKILTLCEVKVFDETCKTCPSGWMQSEPGKSSCTKCGDGTNSGPGSVVCTAAPTKAPTVTTLAPSLDLANNVTDAQRTWNDVLASSASAVVAVSIASTAIAASASSAIAAAVATDVVATGATAAATSAAGGAAAAAAAGPALASMVGMMQNWHMYSKTASLQRDAPAEAAPAAQFAQSMAWTNLQGRRPQWLRWKSADTGRRLTSGDAKLDALALLGDGDAFIDNIFWVIVFATLLLLVHMPVHCYAKAIAKHQKRRVRRVNILEDRLRRGGARVGGPPTKRGVRAGHPVSRWESLAHTAPRLELYAFLLTYQGLAQSSTAAVVNGTGATRIVAGVFFVGVVLGGLAWVAFFVHKNVVRQRRARVVHVLELLDDLVAGVPGALLGLRDARLHRRGLDSELVVARRVEDGLCGRWRRRRRFQALRWGSVH